VSLTLPGSDKAIEVMGQVAWQNAGGHVGLRFTNLGVDAAHALRTWINQNCADSEKDDPPVGCKLTDLSLGGCYLELPSPFPVHTRVVLSMKVGELELRAEGAVRVMHPDVGMGVAFTQTTAEQRVHVEKFIHTLMNAGNMMPELLVEPEGLEGDVSVAVPSSNSDVEDPLLDLFHQKASAPTEVFLKELRKQRNSHPHDSVEETILPV
jgi:hypothetical protein